MAYWQSQLSFTKAFEKWTVPIRNRPEIWNMMEEACSQEGNMMQHRTKRFTRTASWMKIREILLFVTGSHYGSPHFFSGEPLLELTTDSGELVLELTTPTGSTTKYLKDICENFFIINILVIKKSLHEDCKTKIVIINYILNGLHFNKKQKQNYLSNLSQTFSFGKPCWCCKLEVRLIAQKM